jgi:hypothetical protein
VFFADELEDAWRYEHVFRGDVVEDPAVPVVRRSVPDGRTFRVIKVFWNPEELQTTLHALGWDSEIRTAGPFFWAQARHRDRSSG